MAGSPPIVRAVRGWCLSQEQGSVRGCSPSAKSLMPNYDLFPILQVLCIIAEYKGVRIFGLLLRKSLIAACEPEVYVQQQSLHLVCQA